MSVGEKVYVLEKAIPNDYHCRCEFCQKSIGELRPLDGSYYNRLERRKYYDSSEKGKSGHIAKTPLHIARWAVQRYTAVGDWVLDPTIGAGTTAVEAVTQGRSAAGMELEYSDILRANVKKSIDISTQMNGAAVPEVKISAGDAREIRKFLHQIDQRFKLVVNNPPYSGDVSMPSPKGKLRGKEHRHLETRFDYDKTLPNIAFLKEGPEYWDTMRDIYRACLDYLVPGGHFVIGVKDMMRNRESFLLHQTFCLMMRDVLHLEHVGNAFLNHYPRTLFLNTYEKFYGVKPPFYQTICVFEKPVLEGIQGEMDIACPGAVGVKR